MSEKPVILLAEDSDSDVQLVQSAFKRAHIHNPLVVVRDGAEAIAYLADAGQFSQRAKFLMPNLLLLDTHMPVKDGFEVLAWVRQQPELKSLPVIMLTPSDRIADVNQAYRLGANSFFVKPYDFENPLELGRVLHDFWLVAAE
jgi:CheY-like chemotaxis protein